ncbi:MAG: hypothetical protein HYV95_11235 [Opitutae bacterium]|nr:hypothetical protein [Opitutae bacterium]
MKTILISLGFALLLFAAIALSGQVLDILSASAAAFAAALAGWTFTGYLRPGRSLDRPGSHRPRLLRPGLPDRRRQFRRPARLAA